MASAFVPRPRGHARNGRPMSSPPCPTSEGHERYDQRHDHRRGDVRGGRGAPPARAARALLPDARLLRGGRGRAAGGVPARLARARDARRATRSCAPGCTRSPPTSASTRCAAASARSRRCSPRPRCRGCSRTRTGCSTRSRRPSEQPDAVVVARETIELTFIAADPAPARAPARGRDPARRARLVGGRDRGAARHQRRRRQQRAPARPRRRCATELPERPSERRRAELSEDEQRLLAGLHRHPRERRRGGRRGADARGHPRHDAAAADGLRRPRRAARRCSRPRSAPRAWASGGSSRRAPTASPPRPATCASAGETEWRAFKFDILRCEDGGDRRDHDLRRDAVRAVRPAADARRPMSPRAWQSLN